MGHRVFSDRLRIRGSRHGLSRLFDFTRADDIASARHNPISAVRPTPLVQYSQSGDCRRTGKTTTGSEVTGIAHGLILRLATRTSTCIRSAPTVDKILAMNSEIEEQASAALVVLRSYATKATRLAEDLLESNIRADFDDDHFAFMAMCFLSEQTGYLEAITKLVENGLGKPSGLVARSMLEGMALLRWARADPSRPLRWRSYAWIADHRTITRDEESKKAVDPQRKVRIEEALKVCGDQFLTDRARKKKKDGTRLPKDPYVRSWYDPHSVACIFEQVKGLWPLYENIYRAESERTHWSVSSLGKNLHQTSGGFVYAGDASPSEAATFLAVGFQALLETLVDVDDHLNLGRNDQICDLKNRYVRELLH